MIVGQSNEVVADVIRDPNLFGLAFNGMLSDDPLIRMRSADAIEKITVKHPEYLQPYKEKLIKQVAKNEQQEVRWHVAQMISRLVHKIIEKGRNWEKPAILLLGVARTPPGSCVKLTPFVFL